MSEAKRLTEPEPGPQTVRPATKPPVGTRLSPGAALRTFRKLAAGWNLREDRAWIMLTGDPAAPRALTEDQAERVALLVDMDAAISRIVANVGAWLIDPNPGPLLAGRSPLEFLTRAPTPGYATLLRQARRWAEM